MNQNKKLQEALSHYPDDARIVEAEVPEYTNKRVLMLEYYDWFRSDVDVDINYTDKLQFEEVEAFEQRIRRVKIVIEDQ